MIAPQTISKRYPESKHICKKSCSFADKVIFVEKWPPCLGVPKIFHFRSVSQVTCHQKKSQSLYIIGCDFRRFFWMSQHAKETYTHIVHETGIFTYRSTRMINHSCRRIYNRPMDPSGFLKGNLKWQHNAQILLQNSTSICVFLMFPTESRFQLCLKTPCWMLGLFQSFFGGLMGPFNPKPNKIWWTRWEKFTPPEIS